MKENNQLKFYIVSKQNNQIIYLCNKKDALFTYHKNKAKAYKNPNKVIDSLFHDNLMVSTTIHISTNYPPNIWTSGTYIKFRSDITTLQLQVQLPDNDHNCTLGTL